MKYVIGNWKMNLGIRESVALSRGILRYLRGKENLPDISLCPSFTALNEVNKVLSRGKVKLGAQSCGPDKSGAYTGEISTSMLEDAGVKTVLVGHSERRSMGESDELINKRLQLAFESKLIPVLCVGEDLAVRDSGGAFEFVEAQLKSAFSSVKIPKNKEVLVAYEPIWAIGTGNAATPGDAVEMHAKIRLVVASIVGVGEDKIKILYGGSVDSNNAYEFLRESEIDGVLVGGASIKLQEFQGILDAASDVILAQSK